MVSLGKGEGFGGVMGLFDVVRRMSVGGRLSEVAVCSATRTRPRGGGGTEERMA